MRELSQVEVEMIDGGIVPLVVLGFVWHQAPAISSFMSGYFAGAGGL